MSLFPTDQPWRLIPPIVAPGLLQMQIDTWLWQQQEQRQQPPTLRFYRWSTPTISLGYLQRNYPAHWLTLAYQGQPLALVRRPTGGRAVLHHGDLTYAIATPIGVGSRAEIYHQLCQFLIDGWQQLGVNLQTGLGGQRYHDQVNCFGTKTPADLVNSAAAKFIGSAQRYGRQRTVLQHGSMQLAPDPDLFFAVFGVQPTAILDPLLAQTELFVAEVIETLTHAAQHCFGINFIPQALSASEMTQIQAIPISPIPTDSGDLRR